MATIDRNAADANRLRRDMQRLASRAGDTLGFVFNETPAGAINGSNAAFNLGGIPQTGTLLLYVNGLLMREGGDFNLSSGTVTFLTGAIPETGDWIRATYLQRN